MIRSSSLNIAPFLPPSFSRWNSNRHRIIILLCFLLPASGTLFSQPLSQYKPFRGNDTITIYNGYFKIFKTQLNGSLVVRRLGEDHFRLAFFNEKSITFFDIEIHPDRKLSYKFITPKMKNPLFLGAVRKYFFTLLMTGADENASEKSDSVKLHFKKNKYYIHLDSAGVVESYQWKKNKIKVAVKGWEDRYPLEFQITNPSFPLTLQFARKPE